jgi:hypothetical protein
MYDVPPRRRRARPATPRELRWLALALLEAAARRDTVAGAVLARAARPDEHELRAALFAPPAPATQ